MGWLRDFMSSAEPPIPSFGRLARASLSHPLWPTDARLKDRSLSTLFSKLDRGADLDWLRDRPSVQQVLADLLKRPMGDFRAALGSLDSDRPSRFLRLVDVRYARELDLSKEKLPPGIPQEAFTPQLWAPTWWRAPSGSGRSMTGAWLEARGLAHAALVTSHDDLAELPPRGPLFIEIASTVLPEELALSLADLSALRWESRPLCITASFNSPLDAFEQVESPEPTTYLPELVDWVGARLDRSGHFHPDRAETWMRRTAISAGAVNTLGDALGLLGMTDEVHPRSLLAKGLDEIAQHFVRRRVREACERTATAPRLADHALPALERCAAELLVRGQHQLMKPRPLDEWTDMLAGSTDEDLPDPEWFSAALDGALGTRISRRDLRRAAKNLPPRSFQLTRSLEEAGLLIRDTSSHDTSNHDRVLHPQWLVSLLTARATQEVLRLSPAQWGTVLLSSARADDIISSLLERVKHQDLTAIFSIVDDFDKDSPELVAALEGAVIAAGLAELSGSELPEELVEGLLEATAEDILVLEKKPEPRLTRTSSGRFHRDWFLLGLAALLHRCRFPLSHLDVFRSESPTLKRHFCDACTQVLSSCSPLDPLGAEILRLLDELFPKGDDHRPTPLQLADSVRNSPIELVNRSVQQCHTEILLSFLTRHERRGAAFQRDLWKLLADHPHPEKFFSTQQARRAFWREASASTLASRSASNLFVSWEDLLPHQYSDYLNDEAAPPLPEEAGNHCPIDAVLSAVGKRGSTFIPSKTLRRMIARGPGRFPSLVTKFLAEGRMDDARHLLESAPEDASATLARSLPPTEDLLNARGETVTIVRYFLLRACRERHREFETCYQRLTDLERGLQPLKRLG